MQISGISIDNFRNLKPTEVNFGDNINVFFGNNGSGKTNLLEAIFVLLLGRSPRGASDTVLINENCEHYRLEGNVTRSGRSNCFAIAYQRGGRKKITKDKVTIKNTELFSEHTVVSAAPEDCFILAGAPSVRREFINVYLSQASSKYLSYMTDYQKVLAQKNAFLKQNGNNFECPFDELLIKYGSLITFMRLEFLQTVSDSASDYYKNMSDAHKLGIKYIPSITLPDDEIDLTEVEKAFVRKLERYHERERIMQNVMVGPHRDDIGFSINDLPARSHGSQGELRTAAVSLKLAVFDYLKDVRSMTPILLLDEIFAELDSGRQDSIINALTGFGQLFLTTASALPDKLANNCRKFRIIDGAISEE
jgi:DNA replication and repair protein RecF